MPLLVEQFSETDEQQVIALWERCGLLRPWNDPHRDIARKLLVQRELFLVGKIDGRIVGTVMAGYEGHRGWVNYLAVDPDYRRRGFGHTLMKEAERRLLEMGCPKVNLQIRAENEDAVSFYERIGFTRDEVLSMGKRLQRDLPLVLVLLALCVSCSRHRPSETVAAPTPVRASITSLPDNPCDVLTAREISAAIGKSVTRGRRAPDVSEIIRADKESRLPRERAVCSYDSMNEFGSIMIIVPAVSDQNASAFERTRDEYARRARPVRIEGLGEDAWMEGGGALHVLAGKNAQFIVGTRTVRDDTKEIEIAVAKAILARLR